MAENPTNISPDPLMTSIEDLLIRDKIPENFKDVYKICCVLGIVFRDFRIGENMSSVAVLIQRTFSYYDFKQDEMTPQITDLLNKTNQLIAESQANKESTKNESQDQGKPKKIKK